MSHETSKALMRRLRDSRFITRYFVGVGIDIGAGGDPLSNYREFFPGMREVKSWDLPDGDAQLMSGVANNSFDFVHSSHCLEHMRDAVEAMSNWARILKPGGHMVLLVPDEDLYEQGVWPSRYNWDHKTSWTIQKSSSWSPVSVNCTTFLQNFPALQILKLELLDESYRYSVRDVDQTLSQIGESAIEIVLRKTS
jgi:SAM-dependent methyltransferase